MALPSPHFIVPKAHSLPLELLDALNQTYFLHLLVCDPNKVIPPGKALLSMLIHANFKLPDEKVKDDKNAAILDRVKEVAHRAFWNEALEALSSSIPSIQIPRLKQLYLDLHEALNPLFPPTHSILISLASPLPPTSSPLYSTINLLKDVLAALRQRCAPIRDATIDNLDMELAHPPLAKSQPTADGNATDSRDPASPPNALAEFVIDKIKVILALAEDMKRDLNTFVLGSMTESQLRTVLLKDVRMRERQLVCSLWGGEDNVWKEWAEWVEEGMIALDALSNGDDIEASVEKRQRWVKRLLGALGSDKPVHCHFPTPATSTSNSEDSPIQSTEHDIIASASVNVVPLPHLRSNLEPERLPPQLFFSQPTLLYVQNYLQAIVIAAALRSLTRLPPPTKTDAEHDFMERVWTLLKSEIDEEGISIVRANEEQSQDGQVADAGHTKLINLADEVVRARRWALTSSTAAASPPAISADEEAHLRAAVERTLRTSDPVFLLLRKRLSAAIETQVVALLGDRNSMTRTNTSKGIPTRMQTGKDTYLRDGGRERTGPGKRMHLMLADDEQDLSKPDDMDTKLGPAVPGFEEAVLQRAIGDVVHRIVDCGSWTASVWGDL